MEFLNSLIQFIKSTWPNTANILNIILAIIGTLVVILTTLDAIIPDKFDKGFMSKIYSIPILGKIVEWFKGFSALRTEKK